MFFSCAMFFCLFSKKLWCFREGIKQKIPIPANCRDRIENSCGATLLDVKHPLSYGEISLYVGI